MPIKVYTVEGDAALISSIKLKQLNFLVVLQSPRKLIVFIFNDEQDTKAIEIIGVMNITATGIIREFQGYQA